MTLTPEEIASLLAMTDAGFKHFGPAEYVKLVAALRAQSVTIADLTRERNTAREETLRDVIALCERSPNVTAADVAVSLSNFLPRATPLAENGGDASDDCPLRRAVTHQRTDGCGGGYGCDYTGGHCNPSDKCETWRALRAQENRT